MRDIVSYVARSRYAILESLPLAFSLEKNLARCPDFAALIICCSWNKIRSSHNSIYFIFYLISFYCIRTHNLLEIMTAGSKADIPNVTGVCQDISTDEVVHRPVRYTWKVPQFPISQINSERVQLR